MLQLNFFPALKQYNLIRSQEKKRPIVIHITIGLFEIKKCDRTSYQPLQPLFCGFSFLALSSVALPASPLVPPQPLPAGSLFSFDFASSIASSALAAASSTISSVCFLTLPAPSLVPPQPLPGAFFSVPTALGFSPPQPLAPALPGTDTPPPANRPTTPIPARIFFSSFASMVHSPYVGFTSFPLKKAI